MLKSIQLSGFKSFPNKTQLDFSSNITAVVGPNGSGKSNLADCVRWVLGEQSLKNLRIKKTEDLIFGGSENKTRSGRAQASLLLSNSDGRFAIDYGEIKIERQASRDGEGQYLINGSRIRLMDLEELLAKGRMGSKSYCVIHQDMADSLLKITPYERRFVLEEAVGIKEYQLKRIRAERKLISVRDNLLKVSSLIEEILPHLKYLKRQVIQIKKRKELEEKLRECQKKLFGARLKKIKDRKLLLRKDLEKIFYEKEGAEKESKELKRELQNIEKITEKGRRDYDLAQEKIEKAREDRNNLQKELAKVEGRMEIEQEKKVHILPTSISYVKERLEKIYSALKRIIQIEDLPKIQKEVSAAAGQIDILFKEIKEGRVLEQDRMLLRPNADELKKLEESGARLRAELAEIEGDIDKIKEKAGQFSAYGQKERSRLLDVERKIQINQIKIDRLQEKEEILSQERKRLQAEGEKIEREIKRADISLEGLVVEGIEREDIEAKVESIERKLANIGGIDPQTEKEFEETDKRHQFLSSQYDDLKKASISLGEIITELKAKIETQFKEGFGNINREFNKYFRVIFGGGKAKLQSVDFKINKADHSSSQKENSGAFKESEEISSGEDASFESAEPKKTGVEVRVDPPGKKISNLGMLSGGEKALTSIALLFAIIASNPPPFVVLDEVDAALDEANSRRLGNLLKELSKNTQFILITHNRETMKKADILYGVAMEDGVSRLLSLKLDKEKA